MHKILTIIIALQIVGCKMETTVLNISDVESSKDSLSIRNYNGEDNHLFVFVGERISVIELPDSSSMDHKYRCEYKISEKIYGYFNYDTIEFVTYDHYGLVEFSKYKNVLLYVSADSGRYYHQKYLYNDVYRTVDGRWAGIYSAYDYENPYNKYTEIKPIKVAFVDEVKYPTKILWDTDTVNLSYPEPYFKTVNDTAIAIYGNYVEELFALKKMGVLTARGLFAATAEQEEAMVEARQPETPTTPPSTDDLIFLSFWNTFVTSVKEPQQKQFINIALDSVVICDKLLSISNFINKCFSEVIDDEVRKRIIDKTKIEYTFSEVEFGNLRTSNARKEIIKVGNKYRLRQMLVTRSTKNNNPPIIRFDFIETKNGYRLYGIDHNWFKDCCQ